jgi:hypothetical protein
VEKVVEIDFPICLGIGRKRKILPCLLARNSCCDPYLVNLACFPLEFLFRG